MKLSEVHLNELGIWYTAINPPTQEVEAQGSRPAWAKFAASYFKNKLTKKCKQRTRSGGSSGRGFA
jgi:hypothetical protein